MPRHIYLFTTCNPMSAELIIRQMLEYDRQSNEEITMFINSPGGSVKDFFAIYNTMEMIKSPVKMVVLGQAASCAAILAACGNTRLVSEDSEFMLHEVWSFFMGTTTQIDQQSKRMDNMQNRLMKILTKHTGKSEDQINKAMKKGDRYFTAQQAVAFGLADEVIKPGGNNTLKLSEKIHVEGNEFTYRDGKPEVELLCEGKYVHPVYGELFITEEILGQMKDNFDRNVRGIDISIDYTHDNDGGENPAACWVRELSVAKNEKGKSVLKASRVEFTPNGQKKVEEKEYKYASADFVINYRDERGKSHPYVLLGGTLTNRPFIKELNPIKLSESLTYQFTEDTTMEKSDMIAALKNDHGIDVLALEGERDTLKTDIAGLQNQIAELKKVPGQKDQEIKNLTEKVESLETSVRNSEKEQVFNELLADGKVTAGQKERIMETFNSGESMQNFYKDAPVVVKKHPVGGNGEGSDETLTPDEQALVTSGAFTKEEILENRTIESGKKKEPKKDPVTA